jgi:hypothetical protein
MFNAIANWKGAVEINGVLYDTIEDARKIVSTTNISIDYIFLHSAEKSAEKRKITQFESTPTTAQQYIVTVKQYMTKKSTPSFDFMEKWNSNNPMPLRTMIGTIEKETKGMVYMKLHGDIVAEQTQHCMRCGKTITNPVSQFFGMGPECGGHNYVNPFESEEELKSIVEDYRKNHLQKITWEGWIIKSAITSKEELK